MHATYQAAADIDVITSTASIPGLGMVPINAFVLHGPQPVLVDTGAVIDRDEFMTALRSVIDPAALCWIWLSHTDFDHIGALHELLAVNTELRVITTFLSVGIMGLSDPLPMERVHLLNPGQVIKLGNRTLVALKPPVFDNAATMGFVDDTTGVLFSSDCFGALLSAVPESASEIPDDELRQGQVRWATIDSPWVHKVDEASFAKDLRAISDLEPTMILSSHLPAAPGDMTSRMLAALEATSTAEPFVGPDQAALEQMLAQMTSATPR